MDSISFLEGAARKIALEPGTLRYDFQAASSTFNAQLNAINRILEALNAHPIYPTYPFPLSMASRHQSVYLSPLDKPYLFNCYHLTLLVCVQSTSHWV